MNTLRVLKGNINLSLQEPFNTIINKYKFNFQDLFNLNKAKIKKVIKNYNDEQDWRGNIVKELLDIRENQWNSNLDPNEVKDHLHYICTYRDE